MASRPTASEGKGAGEAAARRRACDDRLVAMVRDGDTTAFEAIYDRHSEELLSFCQYMLGCRQDAEDALQSTFASAYRALRADRRDVVLRPWLFTIARNVCVSTLRQRRPESDAELPVSAVREDPCVQAERREDVRHLLADLMDLPERQRVAIVLAELHGFTHSEIAGVLGVRPDQVKSYVFQARSALISDRQARSADCDSIREELAAARGSALLRTHLRRHLRACEECRSYAEELARQRRRLGAWLPLLPGLLLRRIRALFGQTSASAASTGTGGAAVSTSASWGVLELSGGGNAVVAKLLAGMALLGAGGGVSTVVLSGSPLGGARAGASAGHDARPTSGSTSPRPARSVPLTAVRALHMAPAGAPGHPRVDAHAAAQGANPSKLHVGTAPVHGATKTNVHLQAGGESARGPGQAAREGGNRSARGEGVGHRTNPGGSAHGGMGPRGAASVPHRPHGGGRGAGPGGHANQGVPPVTTGSGRPAPATAVNHPSPSAESPAQPTPPNHASPSGPVGEGRGAPAGAGVGQAGGIPQNGQPPQPSRPSGPGEHSGHSPAGGGKRPGG